MIRNFPGALFWINTLSILKKIELKNLNNQGFVPNQS